MLVGGNLPPAGGNLCSYGGATAATAPEWRVQLTVIGAHRENMSHRIFQAFQTFSTSTLPTLTAETGQIL